jgi:hypothetical protein
MPKKEERDKDKYKKYLETKFIKKRNLTLVSHALENTEPNLDE